MLCDISRKLIGKGCERDKIHNKKMSKSKIMPGFLATSALLLATLLKANASLYDLNAIDIDGNNVSLSQFANKVSVVINVATY